MPIACTLTTGGVIIIMGHKGAAGYTIESASPGLDVWAVELTRIDTDAVYRITVDGEGYWRCSCDDWRYRQVPVKEGGCKHCVAVQEIRELMLDLQGEWTDGDTESSERNHQHHPGGQQAPQADG